MARRAAGATGRAWFARWRARVAVTHLPAGVSESHLMVRARPLLWQELSVSRLVEDSAPSVVCRGKGRVLPVCLSCHRESDQPCQSSASRRARAPRPPAVIAGRVLCAVLTCLFTSDADGQRVEKRQHNLTGCHNTKRTCHHIFPMLGESLPGNVSV